GKARSERLRPLRSTVMLRLAYLACLYLWYEICSWASIKHRASQGQTCVGESSGEHTRADEEDHGASTQASLASASPADLVKRKRQGQYRTHGTTGSRNPRAKKNSA
ncbi:unnamed protein product, partial [Ectocarpus sp. 8 AP-2014]